MSDLKMSDADVGEMIAMCVESKLAGFDSVSVDPLHVVEMDFYYQSIIDKQAAEIESIQGELNAAPCKERNKYLIKMSKLQADNELLREALSEMCNGCDTVVSAASIADCALAATDKN